MTKRERALWGLAVVLCVALLSAPALWNGFPLVQYDTGGYLARWHEGYLVPSRAAPYGLLLNAGAAWNFWPNVILQSVLTVWIIALVLRAHGLARPLVMLGVVAMLAVLTTLPWLSTVLLTDIFCGLGVLALYLLVAARTSLKRWECIALIVLVGFAGSTHSATFALLAALSAGAAGWWLFDRGRLAGSALRDCGIAIALGAVLTFAGNFAVSGRVAWTPGGTSILFGRLMQDGIVKRYLDDHCPDPRLVLCAHRAELPMDADLWFWNSSLFDRLGRFAKLGAEMQHIAFDSLREYPLMQIEKAVVAAARQVVAVRTGEGVVHTAWHSYGMMERHAPWVLPALEASRQTRREIDFTVINGLHYPLALLSLALLPLIAFGKRSERGRALPELAIVIIAAVLTNAAICGMLANPHDRYGARIVWLAGFVVAIAALRLAAERKPAFAPLDPVTPPVR